MRRFRVLGAALIGCGITLAVSGGLAGGQPILPDPVEDYANYPDPASGAPAGCDASMFVGLSYSAGGRLAASLQDLTGLDGGVAVTVSWTDVGQECNGTPVVLALKSAPGPTFDPGVNQPIVEPYNATNAFTGQAGSVTLALPSLVGAEYEGCSGQLDAIIGLPLAVVGPDGSFYGAALRGDGGPNMLLSAWNGTFATCEPDETTTTTSTMLETTTTTEAPTTTTTTSPSSTTSELPASTSSSAPVSTARPPAVLAAEAQQLPVTGTRPWVLLVGLAAVGLGWTVLLASRRQPVR